MKDEIYVEEAADPIGTRLRRASWGAIIAGLFVTVIVQITLTMLGVAIGAATVDPLSEARPVENLGTGAAIWLVVSGLIALFAGAWVAGRLSGGPRRMDGLLHGVVTFSVAEVAMILLLATGLSSIVGGAGSLIGQTVRPETSAQLGDALDRMVPRGGSEVSTVDQANAAQTEQRLREVGDVAARGVSKGALLAFIALILGLGVAALGGWVGTASLPRYRTVTTTSADV